jgi:hypothetical protein
LIGRLQRDPGRPLTPGERALVTEMFGTALDPAPVRIHRRRWFPFQPKNTVMAPDGHLWFAPDGPLYRDDFSTAPLRLQALFVHELTHVWQRQRGQGLLLRRHPFCRYEYRIVPGRRLSRYGVEQQAMMVEHAFLARRQGRPHAELAALLGAAGLNA